MITPLMGPHRDPNDSFCERCPVDNYEANRDAATGGN